jgi:uncharacterized protein YndB with AHSA1/START domain
MLVFTVSAEQRMDVPAESVWRLVDDFGAHHRFNPFIETCRITNDIPTGEGAEREICLYDGSVIRQRIVDHQPQRSMVIEVIDANPLLRHHVVEISVTPGLETSCRLAYRVSFRPPFGPLGIPIAVVSKILLRIRYNQLVRGMETYVREVHKQPP